ncbi:hypothetical protein [Priestia megaterium]|uniref:hypothetical protein n=1 Tax=Priestia megaterium TaxID=1404 RepID=UPI0034D7327E
MLGQALESSLDKVIGPLTVNLYKDMQADGLTEQQIAELVHMSRKKLLNFKHKHRLFAKKLTTIDI